MRSKCGVDAGHPAFGLHRRCGCMALMCLTNVADLAHNGGMKRTSPSLAVNIRCGIIITS
jgi:hypothetical protein